VSYFAAANASDPPDFGAVASHLIFVSGGSPSVGPRFRWKALMSPAPGAPQTLLGLQWSLTLVHP
jgi:hypothetical protein